MKSLKTRDVETARLRRWGVLAQVNEWFSEVRTDGYHPLSPELPGCEPGASGPCAIATRKSELQPEPSWRVVGPTEPAREVISQSPATDPAQASKISELIELWLNEAGGTFTKQTSFQHRTAIELFMSSHDRQLQIDAVSRRVAGEFVSTVLLASGRKAATINRIISSLSSMWRWAVRRGLAADNPWTNQSVVPARQSRSEKKRPYQASELKKLLFSNPRPVVGGRYGGALRDLIRLGLLTGARINELCELHKADIDLADRSITIREGKTSNAERIIPVHPRLCGLLERRLCSGSDEFLFPELTPGGPDGKRSWYASKRYTAFRRATLGDDRTVDFHSYRRTFATYLEHASTIDPAVNASVIAELMGHSKQSLALNLYSGGLKVEHLRRAIALLDEVIEPDILRLLG
ncbi:MAG: tyrosine-type recombinase/integrase [Geminicoccaceae bacterium]|nr:tyrosine-type recombinase/integrase [Geminicoccaceae bacterium]